VEIFRQITQSVASKKTERKTGYSDTEKREYRAICGSITMRKMIRKIKYNSDEENKADNRTLW